MAQDDSALQALNVPPENLSPAELAQWVQLAQNSLGGTRYWMETPSPKQRIFLALDADEALFGGSAGGGKSIAMLMDALRDVHHPGYHAIIFRRTFQDLKLPGALMDRARQWLNGTDASWNGQDHQWTFPSGATLTFGFLEHEDDKYRYQGAEFHMVGFDELTQFTESQYTYLFSRLRRAPGAPFKTRGRAASNPGGRGHDWVRTRFRLETPLEPGEEVRRFSVQVEDGEEDEVETRAFVPSLLTDNPGVDIKNYRRMLRKLDPVTRKQLEYGDWLVRPEGLMFKRYKNGEHLIHPAMLPQMTRTVRAWDFAATPQGAKAKDPDWTVGVKMGRGHDGRLYILDVKRLRGSPSEVEGAIKDCAEMDGHGVMVAHEQEPGAAGKMVAARLRREVLDGWEVTSHRSQGNKVERARPLSARWEQGDVLMVEAPWNERYLDELCAFPDVSHDDQVDATSLAYAVLADPAAMLGALTMDRAFERISPWSLEKQGGEDGAPHLSSW